ncbi:MAG: N-acetylmuramoyl-L-alanine amidase [Patescibacteria group bacterium]|jgi:N-acetylmuramoyl-L-alanine amidase
MVDIPKNPAVGDDSPSTPAASGNFMDKLKNGLTLGGDADKWKKVGIVSVIVIAVMGLLSIGIWGVALAYFVRSIGDPSGNSSMPAGECYMPDDYWKNPSSELTVETVKSRVESYRNVSSAENDQRLQKLLTYTRAQGYNPAVALAVWGKESTYTSNAKNGHDFGYLHDGYEGFDKQLEGAIKTFDLAWNGQDPYPKEPGKPIQVSWINKYTPTSDPRNANDRKTFFTILTQAVPEQVVCTGAIGPGGIIYGNRIILDPGHGSGDNRFRRAANGVNNEGDHNWLIATKVKSNLQAAGYEVAFTKDTAASNPDLPVRVNTANASGAAFLISLHSNAKGGVGPIGIVYCDEAADGKVNYEDDECANNANTKHGRDMSHAVVGNLVANLGLTNPRYWGGDLGMLTGLQMPAMLVEMFAHDQESDLAKIDGKSDILAKSISDGIISIVKKNGQ